MPTLQRETLRTGAISEAELKGIETERRQLYDLSVVLYKVVSAFKLMDNAVGAWALDLVCCYYVCFLHYFALFGGLGLNR